MTTVTVQAHFPQKEVMQEQSVGWVHTVLWITVHSQITLQLNVVEQFSLKEIRKV